MSAANKRVDELLEHWLASVERHARYLSLDDTAYAHVQDWPRHQRPTRWIVDLARTRLLELQRHLADRRARGDATFAETLELMGFLTNLLGSEHIERFIPHAAERPGSEEPAPATARARATPKANTGTGARASTSATVRSPLAGGRSRSTRRAQSAASTAARAATPPPRPAAEPALETATVVADAVRLLGWGREWPELAELIARLANRPSEGRVWQILREHRSAIEASVGRATG